MPLWGNLDTASGNQKPLWANTTNAWSKSTTVGETANSVYGFVYGVSATEASNAAAPKGVAHPGWVAQKIGTGPVISIDIVSGGEGVNSAGFILLTDATVNQRGTGANISYSIANAQNTLQASSSNTRLNTVASIVVNNGGAGYANADAITATITGTSIVAPVLRVTLGGRAGRNFYETLVAMGSISGDDPRDNSYFVGA